MPTLIRKLLLVAAGDGLILQPLTRREGQKSQNAVKVRYTGSTTSNAPILERDDAIIDTSQAETAEPRGWFTGVGSSKTQSLEIHGIIGLLMTSRASYLIAITRRQVVAQLYGKPVYVIKDAALIPLSSQKDAQAAINQALDARSSRKIVEDAEIPTDLTPSRDSDDDDLDADLEPAYPTTTTDERPGIARNVIHRKGLYGRFAEQWFSHGGWSHARRRSMGMSTATPAALPDASLTSLSTSTTNSSALSSSTTTPMATSRTASPDGSSPDQAMDQPPSLLTQRLQQGIKDAINTATQSPENESDSANMLSRLVATTKMLFASNTFFFSYDVDITHSLSTQRGGISASGLPLHKSADPLYFWNRHLQSPLIEAGFDEYILPIMQGFVSQKEFQVDAEDFLLTLISRRSTARAGLRYLRRGVDENGNTANSVETEQILSRPSWDPAQRVYAFLQTRGSIPLFFSQTPYSFKPLPVAHGSAEANEKAFKKHFASLAARYGSLHAVSLIDNHGTEVKLGEAFQNMVTRVNNTGGITGTKLEFEWFDFHGVCKGMKFENVAQLVEHQRAFLDDCSWTAKQESRLTSKQLGIVRTNCMDCLDRTNVVQSAFARYILEKQLADQDLTINLTTDPKTTWFNELWADNGDAVSRAYAGTAALKGDYTRTRQRHITGALTDLTLTLSRYYHNIFNDFFSQACIDYLQGTVTEQVFAEFRASMMSADPGIDLQKLRQHAIDTCVKVVVSEHEDLSIGWALSCPAAPNTIKQEPFEECLLLLTDAALYACRFDWNTEKVRSFERVSLSEIQSIQWGAYITSTLAPAYRDEEHNAGFVVTYRPTQRRPLMRVNTRSLQVEPVPDSDEKSAVTNTAPAEEATRIIALKALPNRSSLVRDVHAKPAWNATAPTSTLNDKPLPGTSPSTEHEDGDTSTDTERQLVKRICLQIRTAASRYRSTKTLDETDNADVQLIERDIISLAEAKRSTGYLEWWGYEMKKFVWG